MRIACIGGAHVDRHAALQGPSIPATSNPCNITTSFGGVARNVAENLARLGREVAMVSLVGDDEAGRGVVEHLRKLGVDTSGIDVAAGRTTASYTAILEPDGELVMGLADMDLYEALSPSMEVLESCDLWFLDANLPAAVITMLARRSGHRTLAGDAVSVPKAARLVEALPEIAPLFLNRAQQAALPDPLPSRCGLVTAGVTGVTAWVEREQVHLGALTAQARNVTGAGDALIAGTLFGLTGGLALFEAVPLGLAAAAITVESPHTVAPELTAELMYARLAANRS
jgi:pseudouridine kinase